MRVWLGLEVMKIWCGFGYRREGFRGKKKFDNGIEVGGDKGRGRF